MPVGVGEPLMDSIFQDRRGLNVWHVAPVELRNLHRRDSENAEIPEVNAYGRHGMNGRRTQRRRGQVGEGE